MVLKVETEALEDSKLILCSNEKTDKDFGDLKNEATYTHTIISKGLDSPRMENPKVNLELFYTSINQHDIPLAKECTENLNNQLNKHNVLSIMIRMSELRKTIAATNSPDPSNLEPSAPPIIDHVRQKNEDCILSFIDNIRNNCLLEIDRNADYILKQKEITELSYSDILAITTRDTLQVSNEMLVYSAVMRWVNEQAKRRVPQTQVISMKTALQELVYAPRYGLMTKKEFLCRTIDGVKGPDRSGILEEKETEKILAYIKKKGKNRPVEELPHKGSSPRKKINGFHSGISGDSTCNANTNCDKFIINFLTCWTAIFD